MTTQIIGSEPRESSTANGPPIVGWTLRRLSLNNHHNPRDRGLRHHCRPIPLENQVHHYEKQTCDRVLTNAFVGMFHDYPLWAQ